MEKNKKKTEKKVEELPSVVVPEEFKKLVNKLTAKGAVHVELGLSENLPNFIECESVDDANNVNLRIYCFVGMKNDKYVFKIRQR